MKNRNFSCFARKVVCLPFDNVLRSSLHYPLETMRTHSTNGYIERMYKLTAGLDRKLEVCRFFWERNNLNKELKVSLKI